jgi:hypothetical protein
MKFLLLLFLLIVTIFNQSIFIVDNNNPMCLSMSLSSNLLNSNSKSKACCGKSENQKVSLMTTSSSNSMATTTSYLYSIADGMKIYSAPCGTSTVVKTVVKYEVVLLISNIVTFGCDTAYFNVTQGSTISGFVKVDEFLTCRFFCTIKDAVDATAGGETIIVRPGIYIEYAMHILPDNVKLVSELGLALISPNIDFNLPTQSAYRCDNVRSTTLDEVIIKPVTESTTCAISIGTGSLNRVYSNYTISGFTFYGGNGLGTEKGFLKAICHDNNDFLNVEISYNKFLNMEDSGIKGVGGYPTTDGYAIAGHRNNFIIKENCFTFSENVTATTNGIYNEAKTENFLIYRNFFARKVSPLGTIYPILLYYTFTSVVDTNSINNATISIYIVAGSNNSIYRNNKMTDSGYGILMYPATKLVNSTTHLLPLKLNTIQSNTFTNIRRFNILLGQDSQYNIPHIKNLINLNIINQDCKFGKSDLNSLSDAQIEILFENAGSSLQPLQCASVNPDSNCTSFQTQIIGNIINLTGRFDVPNVNGISDLSGIKVRGVSNTMLISQNRIISLTLFVLPVELDTVVRVSGIQFLRTYPEDLLVNHQILNNTINGWKMGISFTNIEEIAFGDNQATLSQQLKTLKKSHLTKTQMQSKLKGLDLKKQLAKTRHMLSQPLTIECSNNPVEIHYNNLNDNSPWGIFRQPSIVICLVINANCNWWGNHHGPEAPTSSHASPDIIVVQFLTGLYGSLHSACIVFRTPHPDCHYLHHCHEHGYCVWNDTCTEQTIKDYIFRGDSSVCQPICKCHHHILKHHEEFDKTCKKIEHHHGHHDHHHGHHDHHDRDEDEDDDDDEYEHSHRHHHGRRHHTHHHHHNTTHDHHERGESHRHHHHHFPHHHHHHHEHHRHHEHEHHGRREHEHEHEHEHEREDEHEHEREDENEHEHERERGEHEHDEEEDEEEMDWDGHHHSHHNETHHHHHRRHHSEYLFEPWVILVIALGIVIFLIIAVYVFSLLSSERKKKKRLQE